MMIDFRITNKITKMGRTQQPSLNIQMVIFFWSIQDDVINEKD